MTKIYTVWSLWFSFWFSPILERGTSYVHSVVGINVTIVLDSIHRFAPPPPPRAFRKLNRSFVCFRPEKKDLQVDMYWDYYSLWFPWKRTVRDLPDGLRSTEHTSEEWPWKCAVWHATGPPRPDVTRAAISVRITYYREI